MKIGKIKIDQNFALIAVAVVVIAIGGFLVFGGDSFAKIFDFKIGKTLSNEEIAKNSIEYLNNVVLKGQSTATYSTISEESGLVKIKLKVGTNEFDSYATKDGKLLFPQAFNLQEADTGAGKPAGNTEDAPKKTAADIQKVDKPVLDAFVVSKCPFGLQMQRVLADVVKNAPALTPNIVVRYMGSVVNGKITAMHGDPEAQENLRQICIRDEQKSKYWNYISCHIKKGDIDACLTSTGVNATQLNSCMTDPNKGLKYAQVDFDMQNKYNVTGSPTLILQDGQISEFDFGGRNTEALKSLICAGFNSQPSICNTKLNTASAASSFSETYAAPASAASNNTQAGCEPAN